jgi:SAM-dependent methyltransferase
MNALQRHFDWTAENDRKARAVQKDFHAQLLAVHRHHIPGNSRVLEWGCGSGELLRGLEPSVGLGIDVSPKMLEKAQAGQNTASLRFEVGDLHHQKVEEEFDYIVLNYLTGYLSDVQQCFRNLLSSAGPKTRLHITSLNTPWLYPLQVAEGLGAVMKQPPSNWLSRQDITNLLELSGWEVIHWKTEQIFPFQWPLLSAFCNRFLVRLPLLRHLGITLHLVARPRMAPEMKEEISCSVVVPARNEAGNIAAALQRIPVLGRRTEVLFVEGNSTDDTWEVIEREVAIYRGPHIVRAMKQPGRGKWDAVKAGFAAARGEVLVIQDADLTAPPEDLTKFYDAIASGVAEFANGSRLVYPMESQAMRFLNLLGNHFFANALSFVLSQPIKDSLCGTKMMSRRNYERAMKRIEEFGDFDPFGDFSLLFGASLLDLRIRDVPVRYRDRRYGQTNISRFRHGMTLMRMTWFGLRRIRFFPLRMRRWRPATSDGE